MSSISRVAIMGMGIVAPGATGAESFSAMLREGKGGILPVERFDTEGLRAHTAGLLREFRARDFISPMKMRRMNNLSRYAVSATRLALDDQAAASGGPPADHTGVAIGTTFGPVETSVEYMREYVEKGAALAPPQ
ncbi:MAG TPA: beta-ketoacyl synthase N-terminal-like domain-containing protein, partial [Thermoanaerobaculia bacterium]|nr:beta-ketoacyl synthase N-terminal-like domain-containing protein [Thermoanaerobaculia bacterium]